MRFTLDQAVIADFCRRHRIRRLALFGSMLRDDFGPESAVDLLVDFEPGKAPGLLGIVAMEYELAETLALNRKVDLRTIDDLSPHFRDEVSGLAEEIYAAA